MSSEGGLVRKHYFQANFAEMTEKHCFQLYFLETGTPENIVPEAKLHLQNQNVSEFVMEHFVSAKQRLSRGNCFKESGITFNKT